MTFLDWLLAQRSCLQSAVFYLGEVNGIVFNTVPGMLRAAAEELKVLDMLIEIESEKARNLKRLVPSSEAVCNLCGWRGPGPDGSTVHTFLAVE